MSMKDQVTKWLASLCVNNAMERPSNFEEIIDFICEDVTASADPMLYSTTDFAIALRRFIERIN